MNLFYKIVRILVAIIFIFSGLIKLNDPTGTAIKLEEYFEVFSTDFGSWFLQLIPYNLFFSILLSFLEVVLGVALLIRFRFRIVLWCLLILVLFFGFLTFYSAFYNKVTDCGCFGDAIKLTPWQSFGKDMILLIAILFLLIKYRRTENRSTYFQYGFMGFGILFALFIPYYSLRHLPFIDFLPYKVNSNISALMKSSAPLQYQYNMEKDGKIHPFDVYPTDTTYHFKDMILLNPEAKPKITDYYIWNDEGDFTSKSLKGAKLLIIIPQAEEANKKGIVRIKELVEKLDDKKVESMVLTSSDEFIFELFRHDVQLAVPYYFSDSAVLKAMIRANPGIMLLQNGVIKGKWNFSDIPSMEKIYKLIE